MGARSVVAKSRPTKTFKRGGGITEAEKDLVARFVQDQPRELTTSQVSGLARTLRRSREATKDLIEQAKERFVDSAQRYVDIHRQAVEEALTAGEFDTAMKGSQWYLEHVGVEGVGIIDKQKAPETGSKIAIGIKIGGVSEAATAITLPAVTVDPSDD